MDDYSKKLKCTKELINIREAFDEINRFDHENGYNLEDLASLNDQIDGALISCGYLMQTEPKLGYTNKDIEMRRTSLMHYMVIINLILDVSDSSGQSKRKFRESPWGKQLKNREYFDSVLRAEGIPEGVWDEAYHDLFVDR